MRAFKERLEDDDVPSEDDARYVGAREDASERRLYPADARVGKGCGGARCLRVVSSGNGMDDLTEVRVGIVNLLIQSLALPAPNLAHLLLGYEIQRPVRTTVLQGMPGAEGPAMTDAPNG